MGNNNSKRQPGSPRINFPCFTTLILVGESQYLYNHLTLGYVLIFMLHTVFLPQHIPPLGKKQKEKRIISHFLWAGKKSSLKGSQEQFNIGATALSILCIHCSPAEGRSLVYKGICFSQVGLTSPNYSISCGITKKTAAEKKNNPTQPNFFLQVNTSKFTSKQFNKHGVSLSSQLLFFVHNDDYKFIDIIFDNIIGYYLILLLTGFLPQKRKNFTLQRL